MEEWYLLTDYLLYRSIMLTLCILLLSTTTCLCIGLITKRYIIINLHDWLSMDIYCKLSAYFDAFIVSTISLVASTTFFTFAIKDSISLPGLPHPNYLCHLKNLRSGLSTIKNNQIWGEWKQQYLLPLHSVIDNTKNDLEKLIINTPKYYYEDHLFRLLKEDLDALK